MQRTHILRIFEAASILLFFMQAMRIIFSVLFGIIYDQVFEGPVDAWLFASVLLVIIAFLAPVLVPSHARPGWMVLFAVVAVIARVTFSINDPQVRYWGSLVVLAAGGLYLSSLFLVARRMVLPALVVALSFDQLFRLLGHTYDVTLRDSWLPVQIGWMLLLLMIVLWLYRNHRVCKRIMGVPGISWGLAIGGLLFLETSLLSLPNAIARWSNSYYPFIAPVLLVITLLPLFPYIRRYLIPVLCARTWVRIGLGMFLVFTLLIGYFTKGWLSATSLWVAQAAVLISLTCLCDSVSSQKSRSGLGFAFGLIFFLVLNFFNAFAFTYPYTFPFMQGLGWMVYFFAALVLGIGVVVNYSSPRAVGLPVVSPLWSALTSLVMVVIAVVAVIPRPADPLPENGILRVATYNIHYGYDGPWHLSIEEAAKTIEESGADIIALQEVDTGRMTSYCIDNAYYLSRRLRMNVVYLPTVEHLTGIALLHRGQAIDAGGQWVTSIQEQTGVVYAHLEISGQPLHAFGTWIGLSNENTLQQIEETLGYIGDRSPVVFGGDFNSEPGVPVTQAINEAGFIDPFTALEIDPIPSTAPAISPEKRIDYVWVRNASLVQAWVSDSLASDHRMVVVEVIP